MKRKTDSMKRKAEAVSAAPLKVPAGDSYTIGNLDVFTIEEVSGWAWDPGRPTASVVVELLDDDRVIATKTADEFRPDLLDAGFGTGRYGFSIRGLGALLPRMCHRLSVRRADDERVLPGAPRWVVSKQGEPGAGAQLLKDLTDATMATARTADDVEAALSNLVEAAGRLAAKQQSLGSGAANQSSGLLRSLQERHPKLALPHFSEPKVSVIIPVFNRFDLTYHCLKSVSEQLPTVAFEIIVVDDCSTDETVFATLILDEAVRVTRLKANRGFVRACNRGAKMAHGELLFFLNNDTIVKPGWLDELVATFEQTPNIGIAGSRLLNPSGAVQDAGGVVWRLGDAWNWGRGGSPEDPRFTYMRDADYVSGAALMIPKALFNALGGFDSLFEPGYYEDTDLAFRVRAAGHRVVVQPTSQIVHLEGGSAGVDPAGPGMKRFQIVNQRKFYTRWRDALDAHRPSGEAPEREVERDVRRRAFFIDETTPTPDQDAGSNAALEHMRALMELGYKVTFVASDNMARHDPYTRQLERLGIQCSYAPFATSVEQMFRDAKPVPNLIYLHRVACAMKYANMARFYFPHCQIVYSVADLHFLRLEREAELLPSQELSAEARRARDQELSVMAQVDNVIVHSQHELELLARLAPAVDVSRLAWTIRTSSLRTPIGQRRGVAFVGGFRHRPNVDAALHFVRDILPMLRAQPEPLRCILAGSMMPDEVASAAGAGAEVAGFVPRLQTLYEQVRCTAAPLRYGAGIKGKVLDSMAYCVPCVVSEVAAEGLALPRDLRWLVAEDDQQFAQKIITLHADVACAESLALAGQAYIRANFSQAQIVAGLKAILSRPKAVNGAAASPCAGEADPVRVANS
jgi:O-antigen biosynthesis protein